jgi:hypothetical protein
MFNNDPEAITPDESKFYDSLFLLILKSDKMYLR